MSLFIFLFLYVITADKRRRWTRDGGTVFVTACSLTTSHSSLLDTRYKELWKEYKTARMFSQNDLELLTNIQDYYIILHVNGHDIHLYSRITSHEWIIISPYDNSACVIRHRHSVKDSFHIQSGRYSSLNASLQYIIKHDNWYHRKKVKEISLHHGKRP